MWKMTLTWKGLVMLMTLMVVLKAGGDEMDEPDLALEEDNQMEEEAPKQSTRDFFAQNCVEDDFTDIFYPQMSEKTEGSTKHLFRPYSQPANKVFIKMGTRQRYTYVKQRRGSIEKLVLENIEFYQKQFILKKNEFKKLTSQNVLNANPTLYLTRVDVCVFSKKWRLFQFFDSVGYMMEYFPHYTQIIFPKEESENNYVSEIVFYKGIYQLTRSIELILSDEFNFQGLTEDNVGAEEEDGFVRFKFIEVQRIWKTCRLHLHPNFKTLHKSVFTIMNPLKSKETEKQILAMTSLCRNGNVYDISVLWEKMYNRFFPQSNFQLKNCVRPKNDQGCPEKLFNLLEKSPKLKRSLTRVISLRHFTEGDSSANYLFSFLDIFSKMIEDEYDLTEMRFDKMALDYKAWRPPSIDGIDLNNPLETESVVRTALKEKAGIFESSTPVQETSEPTENAAEETQPDSSAGKEGLTSIPKEEIQPKIEAKSEIKVEAKRKDTEKEIKMPSNNEIKSPPKKENLTANKIHNPPQNQPVTKSQSKSQPLLKSSSSSLDNNTASAETKTDSKLLAKSSSKVETGPSSLKNSKVPQPVTSSSKIGSQANQAASSKISQPSVKDQSAVSKKPKPEASTTPDKKVPIKQNSEPQNSKSSVSNSQPAKKSSALIQQPPKKENKISQPPTGKDNRANKPADAKGKAADNKAASKQKTKKMIIV